MTQRNEKGQFVKAEPQKIAVKKVAIDKPIKGGAIAPKFQKRMALSGNKFIFTAAQNNTEVHEKFLHNLIKYADFLGAKLIIGTFLYNKSGFQNGEGAEEVHFEKSVKPYLLDCQALVCDSLVWCGDVNVLPTAKYPLSGFEQYTGPLNTIIPTARIALESVATSKGKAAKHLYGTGCVTQRNYIDMKAGQVADAAHSYGALIVETLEDGQFFARQIETDETGAFFDLNTLVDQTVLPNMLDCVSAINLGDLHAEKSDSAVIDCVEKMLFALKPSYVLIHDCFDMTTRNHHNRKNPHFIAKMGKERQTVKNDLAETVSVLSCIQAAHTRAKLVIVESNHDLALEKWLQATDYDFRYDDSINAQTYLELQLECYKAINAGFNCRVLETGLRMYAPFANFLDNVKFLETDESFIVAGVELGFHGHTGINGSKGSPKQFQKLNMPINTGHTHSCSIYGGVYTAGVTGKLDMDYNTGPSSWSHSHILTYANGMRCIITMVQSKEGEWLWSL